MTDDMVCRLTVDDFRVIHSILQTELGGDMECDEYQALCKVQMRVEAEIDRVDMLRVHRAKDACR